MSWKATDTEQSVLLDSNTFT